VCNKNSEQKELRNFVKNRVKIIRDSISGAAFQESS
jgi:hypothetical protein